MIIVQTSNIAGDCEFETLEEALEFISDQVEMGFSCSVQGLTPEQQNAVLDAMTEADK